MNIAVAVVCALCAAFCFALGSLFQQSVARQAPEGELHSGLLTRPLHEPWRLARLALSAGSSCYSPWRLPSARFRSSSRWQLPKPSSPCRSSPANGCRSQNDYRMGKWGIKERNHLTKLTGAIRC
jgi:hypothetical protein